jgi:hypothetical protein
MNVEASRRFDPDYIADLANDIEGLHEYLAQLKFIAQKRGEYLRSLESLPNKFISAAELANLVVECDADLRLVCLRCAEISTGVARDIRPCSG